MSEAGASCSLTADFLVFEHGKIVLVECKPEAKLIELAASKPAEWVRQDGGWTRPPVDRWAEYRGLTHMVWSPPQPYVNYLANLELLYDRLCQPETPPIQSLNRLVSRLRNEPLSLEQAHEIRGVTLGHILWALANGQVYGTLQSVSLSNIAHFTVFACAEQAASVDELQLQELHQSFKQPDRLSRLLLASPTDFLKGRERLERVMRILGGQEPRQGKIVRQVKAVEKAIQEGTSPLEACLTNYSNCGRRVPQLVSAQEDELERQVRAFKSGAAKSKRQAFFDLRRGCEARGIRSPAYATLLERLKGVSPSARALRTAGRRAYHAERPAIDPQFRSQPAAVFGLTAHVDSTKFDARCIATFRGDETKEAPTLYVAADQATGLPLGRALVFGAARREALAILLRDVLHRNGFLPKYWLTDGGSEYTSHWFLGFAEAVGICRLQPPPGAPKHNSLIENLLGRINQQVAHQLIGSTAPDKQGRRVDAPFKSYRQAKFQFCEFVRQIDAALFDDFAASPLRLRPGTPEEHRSELCEEFGRSGIALPYDESFLIMTSLPLNRDCRLDPRRGVRHQGRTYSSAKLLECAAHEEALEKRRDCVDPSRMYIKFKRGWVIAFSEDAVKLQAGSDEDRLFESLCRADLEVSGRRRKMVVEANRFDRLKQANAAAAATTHLRSLVDVQKVEKAERTPWLSDDVSLGDFDSASTR